MMMILMDGALENINFLKFVKVNKTIENKNKS